MTSSLMCDSLHFLVEEVEISIASPLKIDWDYSHSNRRYPDLRFHPGRHWWASMSTSSPQKCCMWLRVHCTQTLPLLTGPLVGRQLHPTGNPPMDSTWPRCQRWRLPQCRHCSWQSSRSRKSRSWHCSQGTQWPHPHWMSPRYSWWWCPEAG